jgi:long-chain fatty acid transport protein
MRHLTRTSALAAASLAAVLAAQGPAHAGAFGVREQSATAQGLSFAGAASGSGRLSSIFWNPATITLGPGWQSETHLSLVIPDVPIDPLPPTPTLAFGGSGDIGQDAIVPTGYNSYQLSERLWVGVAGTAPFGLITDPRDVWAGQVYSRSSRIFSLSVNPILGIKLADWLSIGAGPVVQYFDVRLKSATGILPTAPNAILEGDDLGFGFTAGVTVAPFAGTSIGIGYRSSINHELEGSLVTPVAGVPIRASVNTPDQITVGLSQTITSALTFHAGFEWSNWSRLGTQAIVGPAGVPVSRLALNYEDGYFYALGLEYRVFDRLTLRGGVAYEQSPIDTAIRSTRLPDNDRYWASLGATYQWSEKLSFDLAYTFIWVKDTQLAIVPGHQDFAGLPFVADVDSTVNIVSAAIRYRWDDPTVPIPAPIVRKD